MLVYDIEIHNAIPDKSGVREPDIQYCEGWGDHAGMGIACIGAIEVESGRPRLFYRDNLAEFAELIQRHQTLIGFNSINFDNVVLAASGIVIPEARCYDLLREIWNADGLGPKFSPATHGGYSLDACAAANFGAAKSGNGALAPVQFQRGQYGALSDYCLNDVHLTRLLLDQVLRHGSIAHPKQPGRRLFLRSPWRPEERQS